jgi:hypothetical protein
MIKPESIGSLGKLEVGDMKEKKKSSQSGKIHIRCL